MTDRQVLDVLNGQTGRICGRFRPEQVDRPLVGPAERGSKAPWLRLMTLSLFGWQTAQAQLATPVVQAQPGTATAVSLNPFSPQPAPATPPAPQSTAPADSSWIITGRVTAQDDGSSLPDATVSIRETNTGVATDAQGNFKLRVPAKRPSGDITVSVKYIGYVSQEYKVRADERRFLDVALAEDTAALGEVIMVGRVTVTKRPSLWQRLFHSKAGR